MSTLHSFLSRWRRDFEQDANKHSAKFYRVMNEVPTLILIVIVIMVIVRPF
jgi:putative membrane protein